MPKNRIPLSIPRLLGSTGDRRVNTQPPISGSVHRLMRTAGGHPL
jgi:hypothetical protein